MGQLETSLRLVLDSFATKIIDINTILFTLQSHLMEIYEQFRKFRYDFAYISLMTVGRLSQVTSVIVVRHLSLCMRKTTIWFSDQV